VEQHLFDGYLPAAYRPHPDPARRCPWQPAKARRWLAFLAGHLERRETADLAWWELHTAVPRLVTGLAFGLAAGFVAELAFGLADGLVPGLAFGPVAGLADGLYIGLLTGLCVGFTEGPRQPSQGLRWSLSRAGLAGGLGPRPPELAEAADPRTVLGRDRGAFRTIAFAIVLTAGLAGGLAAGLAGGLRAGLAGGLAAGLGAGFAVGIAVGSAETAWGQFAVARCWLALRGRLPWRLMGFLADAHEQRNVLRQAGAAYQCRHAELQRHLAGRGSR
jgi:hypothetical protein